MIYYETTYVNIYSIWDPWKNMSNPFKDPATDYWVRKGNISFNAMVSNCCQRELYMYAKCLIFQMISFQEYFPYSISNKSFLNGWYGQLVKQKRSVLAWVNPDSHCMCMRTSNLFILRKGPWILVITGLLGIKQGNIAWD